MLCADNTLCDIRNGRWGCCQYHGGRSKCPKNFRFMCNMKIDVHLDDYWCRKDCAKYGGLRVCGKVLAD